MQRFRSWKANPLVLQLKHSVRRLLLWLDVWSKEHCEIFVVSLDYCSCEIEWWIVYIVSLLAKFTGMAPTVCMEANLNYNLKMPLSLSPQGWSGKYRLIATAESLSCRSLSHQRSQCTRCTMQLFHPDGSFIFPGFAVCLGLSYDSNQGKKNVLKNKYEAWIVLNWDNNEGIWEQLYWHSFKIFPPSTWLEFR